MGLLNFDDPDSAGMMGIAQGLLSASGPSRMPVSLGQALGAASAQGQQQYQAAQASRRQDLAYQMQILQMQQQMRQQAIFEKALQEEYGGGNIPAQPQPAAAVAPSFGIVGADGFGPNGIGAAQNNIPIQQVDVTPSPTSTSTQVSAAPWSQGKIRLFAMSGNPGLQKAAELEQQRQLSAQTDLTKTMIAAGIDPNSTLGKQLAQANLAKQNYIAPVSLRPGGYAQYADGRTEQMPHVPDGFQAIKGVDNQWHIVPVDGGVNAITSSSAAAAAGRNAVEPISGFSGNQPVFTNKLAAATGGMPQAANPQDQAAIDAFRNRDRSQPFNMTADQSGALVPRGAVTPAPALGAEKGATLGQEELSKKWGELTGNNQQAQPTISYLQSIKQQAEKAATGPMSDKVQFANGLLAFAGVSDRALDATTANNLLDKYSNQIVSRLGTGGLGTDAARSILQSAYPNAHMTKEAINEAADNLIGAQQMLQAKAKLLSPAVAKRDPVAYQQAEVVFDQNADPRIWQLQGMNAQQQEQYVKTLPAPVAAQILKQRQALKQLGVF